MPLPSAVWNHFTRIDLHQSSCNICFKKIKCENTTSGMMYHLKVHKIHCEKVRGGKKKVTLSKLEKNNEASGEKKVPIPLQPIPLTASDLSVCIVDHSDIEKKISDSNWLCLMNIMRNAILEYCLNKPCHAPAPKFSSGGWCNGFRVTECSDELSLWFLKDRILKLVEIWPGAKLDILRKEDVLMKQKAIVCIPLPIIDTSSLQIMLRHQNPEINPEDLIVLRPNEEPTENGQSFILDVGESAVGVIKSKEHLNMGMDVVQTTLIPTFVKEEECWMESESEVST